MPSRAGNAHSKVAGQAKCSVTFALAKVAKKQQKAGRGEAKQCVERRVGEAISPLKENGKL